MVVATARQVLVVRPWKIAKALLGHFQNPRRQRRYERAIVRHEQHRAFERRQRACTSASIASRSRWLVGSSSTSTFGYCTMIRQNTSRAASPPESAETGLFTSSPENSMRPRWPRTVLVPSCGIVSQMTCSGVERAVRQKIVMILSKVADARFVTPAHAAGVLLQVTGGDLEQRRFAEAVRADDRDALAAPHDQRHACAARACRRKTC